MIFLYIGNSIYIQQPCKIIHTAHNKVGTRALFIMYSGTLTLTPDSVTKFIFLLDFTIGLGIFGNG